MNIPNIVEAAREEVASKNADSEKEKFASQNDSLLIHWSKKKSDMK